MGDAGSSTRQSKFPLAAHLRFVPGGVDYSGGGCYYQLHNNFRELAKEARKADDVLYQHSKVHYLPSLSVLAHAALEKLTAVPNAVEWLNALVLEYSDSEHTSVKSLLQSYPKPATKGPCGYVFQRGDIAWNCRTCQTDATCVICDSCFQKSEHEGHEVYFHRTSPGGCCDCGDAEAWKAAGCCPDHRPTQASSSDIFEAVTQGTRGQAAGAEAVSQLPPRVAAALGVVIGAAVHTIEQAVQGSGIGADPVQWKRVWADEAAKICNTAPHLEEYGEEQVSPSDFWQDEPQKFPRDFKLQLRLHNDDVHTFEEVIEALNGRRVLHEDAHQLVPHRESATKMTHLVDSEGQVTVREYLSLKTALQGFQRLKSVGLHCSVVSTPQIQLEQRAQELVSWLVEISTAHSAATALIVQAFVQVDRDHSIGGVAVWKEERFIPAFCGSECLSDKERTRIRLEVFPPQLPSSYLTREEAELLHGMAMDMNQNGFCSWVHTSPHFYSRVAYRLPSQRYQKSPHSLWGTLPSTYSDPLPATSRHPILHLLAGNEPNSRLPNALCDPIFLVDTDLRKQQNPKNVTCSLYPHKLPGLNLVSGVGTIKLSEVSKQRPAFPSPMHVRHLLAISSFKVPTSPILIILLLDPYPTKQLRGSLHKLFLSLLTDSRFKSRFAGALGVAYRPLSTLFCAGVGTDADTPLHFSVQILTAGSLVRALCSPEVGKELVCSDQIDTIDSTNNISIGVFVPPIAHVIVRCVHTNLLGSTKEVEMILKNTATVSDDHSYDGGSQKSDNFLQALTYVAGEHPLSTSLPAAPDDAFLDSRSTRHKRLPHLLRDLEYVLETPGTACRLLQPVANDDTHNFATAFARMLRLAQGMDAQKRKISGGHVEYEKNRWLEAFGLSLNMAGVRDALAESPLGNRTTDEEESGTTVYDAIGHLLGSLLREIKYWLYRESLLEPGLPVANNNNGLEISALQRSTLHVSNGFNAAYSEGSLESCSSTQMVALACATGIRMTEAQLALIENALKIEATKEQNYTKNQVPEGSSRGPLAADWLRVPHSPIGGDLLSFHLPLHRAVAKCVSSVCSSVVTEEQRASNPRSWWKLPALDGNYMSQEASESSLLLRHPLIPLLKSTLRSSNCRINWSDGPDCTPTEAQNRRSRSRTVSANVAIAKVVHSLADHPMRCIVTAQQVERHIWARNGASVAGMAMNYSSVPLCRSFRDLDLLLIQFSASGMSSGLGAARIFTLMLSRFGMEGYLCDIERKPPLSYAVDETDVLWENPPRLQDPDHAVMLAESFFSTLCVLVTELPPPPPTSSRDDTPLRQSIRRELLHALITEPRSYSEAMTAASNGLSRREDNDSAASSGCSGSIFTNAFNSVLTDIGNQRNKRGTRGSSGPPQYELKAECCEEYDPSFFHLKRQDHQHAMDVVARLRKTNQSSDASCLPIVCPPPKAHPRFLSCRLLLHLEATDAAIRRVLLFALTNGSWLPPPNPKTALEKQDSETGQSGDALDAMSTSSDPNDVPVTTFNRRLLRSHGSTITFAGNQDMQMPFSKEVVASSAVSYLEVLQLLTLQVHTLEECAALHRVLPDLDAESRQISSSLSINSYLRRLLMVPTNLAEVWALRPYPDGPLQSAGSGEKRGSILGYLIALYEHRSVKSVEESENDVGDEGHGGARVLVSQGLKFILRFVNALVNNASNVSEAVKSASTGVPARQRPASSSDTATLWTIDETTRDTIVRMLSGLPDLWPSSRDKSISPQKTSMKNSEAGKAAQRRQMEIMKKMQAQFAATIKPSDDPAQKRMGQENSDQCIICRCDHLEGENNGPLGYLGHVQRSRVSQLRCALHAVTNNEKNMYQVIGHMGCQIRETEALDSAPLGCLPRGSVVEMIVMETVPSHGIKPRRVKVRHKNNDRIVEGWASIQSSQGYVILRPLHDVCFSNSRWGCTRPVVKQCGHAAHLRCVEQHTLSLQDRATNEQQYDGRFAANIGDGEFLCPLCKQLCNVLIPRDNSVSTGQSMEQDIDDSEDESLRSKLMTSISLADEDPAYTEAVGLFGAKLYDAMNVRWKSVTQQKAQTRWNLAIQKWDFEELSSESHRVNSILRLLRQQLIAWAAVGHSAAVQEAASRSREEALPFGVFPQTDDPWSQYLSPSRGDHPLLLELKRSLTASSGLFTHTCREFVQQLQEPGDESNENAINVIGLCLANILHGCTWDISMSATLRRSLRSIVGSMPCHVSRDGTISQRSEARACASAMWIVHGLGTGAQEGTDEPPAPLASECGLGSDVLEAGWGSLRPPVDLDMEGKQTKPCRPTFASVFLHLPLLCWDLNTYTASLFSVLLSSSQPCARDALELCHKVMIGRLIQSLVTPDGFDYVVDLDEEDCWTADEIVTQQEAMKKLLSTCAAKMKKSFGHTSISSRGMHAEALLAAVGRSILPFCRSLFLMLRAFMAALRDRSGSAVRSDDEVLLDTILVDPTIMTLEDGFHFVKKLRCPTPSQLLCSQAWGETIESWLDDSIEFELHHNNGDSPASQSNGHGTRSLKSTKNSVEETMNDAGGDVVEMVADDDEVHSVVEFVPLMEDRSIEDNSEDEAMQDIDEQHGIRGVPSYVQVNETRGESDGSDDYSSVEEGDASDALFAHVSSAPVLYFHASTLGAMPIGPGKNGASLDTPSGLILSDCSHLGLIHQRSVATFSLIRLPKSFVELYNLVSKVKGRDESLPPEETDDAVNAETAICLVTGAVMRSGAPRRPTMRARKQHGACTVHARQIGSGIGIFFLVQKCTVLLMHNNKSAYSPSIYVDAHGEEDPSLKRGRPLFLNEERYRALELLWRQQNVPGEVAQIRSTSDRVIRDNWY